MVRHEFRVQAVALTCWRSHDVVSRSRDVVSRSRDVGIERLRFGDRAMWFFFFSCFPRDIPCLNIQKKTKAFGSVKGKLEVNMLRYELIILLKYINNI
jgi:hypothetical protein